MRNSAWRRCFYLYTKTVGGFCLVFCCFALFMYFRTVAAVSSYRLVTLILRADLWAASCWACFLMECVKTLINWLSNYVDSQ